MQHSSVLLLTTQYSVWYGLAVNDIQRKLAELQGKGWTLAAIADAIGLTHNAVEKWKAGARHPANPTLLALDDLKKRKAPKKRRYAPREAS